MIDEIIQHKPRLILLNKADMADPIKTNQWLEYYKSQGKTAIAINSQAGNGLHQITTTSKLLLKEKYDRMESRGIKPRAIRAMIVGIPNVGKSTLINRLARKNIAKTGNTPGVTKAQQWIKFGKELELLDTPGILWPKFEDQEVGLRLALTGAIKDTILNLHEVSLYGLRFLEKEYPDRLKSRYNLDVIPQETLELFDAVGKFRGCIASGGYIDYDKTAELVVREIRSEKMGPLTFELPPEEQEENTPE